jgi:hypothetical protein
MDDLLGSLIWGAKSGQYCVIGGGSLQQDLSSLYRRRKNVEKKKKKNEGKFDKNCQNLVVGCFLNLLSIELLVEEDLHVQQ